MAACPWLGLAVFQSSCATGGALTPPADPADNGRVAIAASGDLDYTPRIFVGTQVRITGVTELGTGSVGTAGDLRVGNDWTLTGLDGTGAANAQVIQIRSSIVTLGQDTLVECQYRASDNHQFYGAGDLLLIIERSPALLDFQAISGISYLGTGVVAFHSNAAQRNLSFFTDPSALTTEDRTLLLGNAAVAPTTGVTGGAQLWSTGEVFTTHVSRAVVSTTRGTITPIANVEVTDDTTDATPLDIPVLTPGDGVMRLACIVIARENGGGNDRATFILNGSFDIASGVVVLIGGQLIDPAPHATAGASAWLAELATDGTDVLVTVTGDAATNIDWAVAAEFSIFG